MSPPTGQSQALKLNTLVIYRHSGTSRSYKPYKLPVHISGQSTRYNCVVPLGDGRSPDCTILGHTILLKNTRLPSRPASSCVVTGGSKISLLLFSSLLGPSRSFIEDQLTKSIDCPSYSSGPSLWCRGEQSRNQG